MKIENSKFSSAENERPLNTGSTDSTLMDNKKFWNGQKIDSNEISNLKAKLETLAVKEINDLNCKEEIFYVRLY